jgi:glycosyltransferase involved in cell wall biosynthesis
VCTQLIGLGHSVVVYTFKTRGHEADEIVEGIEVRRLGPSLFSSLYRGTPQHPYLLQLLILFCYPRALLRDRKLDALFTQTNGTLLMAGLLSRFLRPVVWSVVHDFHHPIPTQKRLVHFLFDSLVVKMPVCGFVAVGNQVRKRMISAGAEEHKITVIRGGANLAEIDSVPSPKTPHPQVCFMSRFVANKAPDDMIRAFALVREQLPNSKLVMIGDGPLRSRVEQLADSLRLRHSVRFLGALSGHAKYKVLKESHVLVQPSLVEGASLTAFESLASSTPVIAYDIPEFREQFALTGGGILVPLRNVPALANAILSLLRNPSLRDKLSIKGRETIEANHTWTKVAEELEALIIS